MDAANGIPCMVMRGGSSKGAYFLADQLPSAPEQRNELLLAVMGTPDPRQIDGIGGGHPLTSKVAVVGPARDDRADIEYLFLQIGVDEPLVSEQQNCGNILAGVAPFALERGLIAASDGEAQVRIHLLNTDAVATASFSVADGAPLYAGGASISGVPGTGSPIRLDFDDLAGGTCGSLLPSSSTVDAVAGIDCTLIDNGMPVVVMRADAVGVTGYEACAELEANMTLRAKLEDIRQEAGRLMNLGDVADSTVPKLTLVAPPRHGGTLCTRTFIPHRCHSAIGVLGAVSVATAARLPGTPAAEVAMPGPARLVALEHPSGTFEAAIELGDDDGLPTVERAGIIRTARKLMDGTVFPRSS